MKGAIDEKAFGRLSGLPLQALSNSFICGTTNISADLLLIRSNTVLSDPPVRERRAQAAHQERF